LLLSTLNAEPDSFGRLPEFPGRYAKVNITLFQCGWANRRLNFLPKP
jgi:hypothetical protein